MSNPLRRALCGIALCLAGLSGTPGQAQTPEPQGQALPGLEAFDVEVAKLMQDWSIPGASLAVAKDGKLLLAKGYGWADRDSKTAVTAQTLFRMGSINKTLTAIAVHQLVEDKQLALDQPVMPLLAKLGIVPARLGDLRSPNITVRHLLQHSGGMDREKSGDPFFQPTLRDVARRQGVAPVSCEAVIKDTLERPLDFAPGERFAYSNTGYCMLGKVVEAVSGDPIGWRIGRSVLQPVIGKDFLAGKSLDSLPGETCYHSFTGEPSATAAPGLRAWAGVTAPYGSYSIESMDALGSWVATPSDVLKVFLAIDGARGTRLLPADTLRAMQAEPSLSSVPSGQSRYMGLGVEVAKTTQGANWWHCGSQPGVQTLALRTAAGYAWVIAFNSRPSDKHTFFGAFDKALWRATLFVKVWPQGDLF